jgi:hypothetical protein
VLSPSTEERAQALQERVTRIQQANLLSWPWDRQAIHDLETVEKSLKLKELAAYFAAKKSLEKVEKALKKEMLSVQVQNELYTDKRKIEAEIYRLSMAALPLPAADKTAEFIQKLMEVEDLVSEKLHNQGKKRLPVCEVEYLLSHTDSLLQAQPAAAVESQQQNDSDPRSLHSLVTRVITQKNKVFNQVVVPALQIHQADYSQIAEGAPAGHIQQFVRQHKDRLNELQRSGADTLHDLSAVLTMAYELNMVTKYLGPQLEALKTATTGRQQGHDRVFEDDLDNTQIQPRTEADTSPPIDTQTRQQRDQLSRRVLADGSTGVTTFGSSRDMRHLEPGQVASVHRK